MSRSLIDKCLHFEGPKLNNVKERFNMPSHSSPLGPHGRQPQPLRRSLTENGEDLIGRDVVAPGNSWHGGFGSTVSQPFVEGIFERYCNTSLTMKIMKNMVMFLGNPGPQNRNPKSEISLMLVG